MVWFVENVAHDIGRITQPRSTGSKEGKMKDTW